MNITNKFNLPESLVNVLSRGHAPVPNRFSASDIINPPWMRILRERNYDRIEQDISDMLWMLLGSSVHYILEGGSPDNALAEEKMTVDIDGFTIVCIPDLWHNNEISDWKVTSVYSFLLGNKPEWEKQLNIYKWMYAKHGFETNKLTINAILRDWNKGKSLNGDNYPQIPFMSIDLPLWENEHTEKVICDWLASLDCPEPCNDEERWARPTTYAVMSKGRKTALRILDTEDNAKQWMVSNTDGAGYYIQERKGEYVRCKHYCQVREFCSANPYREKK